MDDVKRLTREESRALTRMKLLESARQLMARDGYEAVSVDRVAENAGYSKGAFYSNFASKEEIFLELLEDHANQDICEIRGLFADITEPAQVVVKLSEWAAERAGDPSWGLLALEVFRRARRDETFGDRHANLFREQWTSLGVLLLKLLPEGALPTQPAVLGGIVFELIYGAAAGFTNGPTVKDMIATVLDAIFRAYGGIDRVAVDVSAQLAPVTRRGSRMKA